MTVTGGARTTIATRRVRGHAHAGVGRRQSALVADVETWKDKNINLKRADFWLPRALPGEGRIITARECRVTSKNTDHQPPDREHTNH